MQDDISQIEGQDQSKGSWLSRNNFSPTLFAIIWAFIALLLFQLFSNILVFILVLAENGMPQDPNLLMDLLAEKVHLVLMSNSIGQILFLLLPVFLVARLATNKKSVSEFLGFSKVKRPQLIPIALSILFILALQPIIMLLGFINSLFPFPESYMIFEEQQLEFIANFLSGENSLLFLLINIALVPALCEEALFRGLIYKFIKSEKGIITGLLVSGILFGFFHIRLTQVVPLATIGVFLAWLVYKSGSIYPAIVAHFVNNGLAVSVSHFFPSLMEEFNEAYLPPWWAILLSVILSYACYILFEKWSKERSVNVQ